MSEHCKKPPQSVGGQELRFHIETEQEVDGRWIAEVAEVPGALAYGVNEKEAVSKAFAIALRSLADNIERSQEEPPASIHWQRAVRVA